jgi:hypothetical protein
MLSLNKIPVGSHPSRTMTIPLLSFLSAVLAVGCWGECFADPAPNAPDRAATKAGEKTAVALPADLQTATKLVSDVYKDDIAKAKKPEEKAALAKKLLQAGIDEQKDMAGKYALLMQAKDTAVSAGELDSALASLAELDKSFQFDVLRLKADTLASLDKTATTSAVHKAINARSNQALDEAVRLDRYDLAKKFSDLALASARKANDPSLVLAATNCATEVTAIELAYRDVAKVLPVLDKMPTDPAANLQVGKYRCFMKGDWDGGLAMLALGSDPIIKQLAAKELEGLPDADAQASVGDGWWDLADKQQGIASQRIRSHAASFYTLAAPSLSGLAKARVEKRLAEIGPRSVDVLKMIDPKRDAKLGQWTVKSGVLTADAKEGWAGLELPTIPKGDYDLTVTFSRLEGIGPVEIYLKRMGHHCGFVSFGEELKTNAFGDAKRGRKSMTRTGDRYLPSRTNQISTVVAKVRASGVTVSLNGVTLIDHQSVLSEGAEAPTPSIMIAVDKCRVRFESIEITEVSKIVSK